MKLSPIEQQIYDLVRIRPRTRSELMALIWWIHPQDAPHPSNIKAHVWRINRKIRRWGETIHSTRGGYRGWVMGHRRHPAYYIEQPYTLVTNGKTQGRR